MNVLIIEDEALAIRRLKKLLNDIDPSIQVVESLDSVENSVVWLRNHPEPDMMFVDIQLSDGLSFDIFKRCSVAAPVVFVTAYDEYALQAFKVNSIDYLLKPVEKKELAASIGTGNSTNSNYYDNSYKMGPLTDWGSIVAYANANPGQIGALDEDATHIGSDASNFNLEQRITAGYVMNTTQFGKLHLQAGCALSKRISRPPDTR